MKKLFYGFLGLIVLLVAAAVVGPSFVDWNAHKDRLTSEVRKLTGRDLLIGGDMTLSIWPTPALSAKGVRLANVEGGSATAMIELDELRVRVALMPLLQGKVQLESVSLVEPKIVLEVLADGRRNWDLALAGLAAPQGGGLTADIGRPGGLAEQIQFDSFTIENGSVIYRDALKGHEERIDRLNAQIVAESLRGPFTARGSAVAREVGFAFDFAAGRIVFDGATAFKLGLRHQDTQAELQFAGALSMHPDTVQLRGKLKSGGDNLAAVLQSLTGGAFDGASAALAQTFALETEVTANSQLFGVSDLSLRLGDMSLAGEVTARLQTPVDLSVVLAAGQIDLDRLLARKRPAEGGTAAGGRAASTGGGQGSVSPAVFTIPDSMTGTLDLAVEALVYRGQVVRQLRLNASLADARVAIDQAFALLPGSSDLSMTGTLVNADGTPQFNGRLEAASDNLRGVMTWLGADMSDIPADRLRRMDLSSRIDATTKQLIFSDIDLRVDLSRITGGIVVAPRARLGLGIGLAIDNINLDAYLPTATRASAPQPTQAAATPGAADAAAPDRPGLLDQFDANLKLRVGSLSALGMTAKSLHVDGTLQGGVLTLHEARVGDVAGSSGRFVGVISGLTGVPAAQGTLEVSVTDPVRLAKLAGIESAVLESTVLQGIGPLTLTGDFDGTPQQVKFSATLNALDGRLALAGTAEPGRAPLVFDLEAEASHGDLAALATGLLGPDTATPDLGALNLHGRVTGTPRAFRISGLSGSVGPIDLSGELSADLAGPRPAVTVALTTGEVPLAALSAVRPTGVRGAQDGGSLESADERDTEQRWSTEPLDLSALRALDADIKLSAAALIHDELRIDEATVEATLRDGVLRLINLTGGFYGGKLQASGEATAVESPAGESLRAALTIDATGVDSARLLREHSDVERISGPISIAAQVTSQGSSEAELISALNGTGQIIGSLQFEAKAEERASALILGVLGSKIKEIQGIGDAGATLITAFAGAPAALQGSFAIENGVVRTDDLRLDGSTAYALTKGSADLPRWRLDSESQVFREQDAPTAPYLTAVLQGPLDRPNPRIAGVPLRARPEQAAGGGSAPDGASIGPLPSVSQPVEQLQNFLRDQVKPEDLIDGILERLAN